MAIKAFFILLAVMFGLLFSGCWIGVTLFIVGFVGLSCFTTIPPVSVLGTVLWNQSSSSAMLALPLFIFMGEILVQSKISNKLFSGLSPWVNKLPGRLLHVNTVASAFFAAVSGSVSATTATVGKITIPEFKRRGYSDELSIGTLACSGTIGIMIPPSMTMLVYGIIGNVSVGKLFIGGIVPGILMAILFSLYIIIRCIINPNLAPSSGENFTWKDRLKGLPDLLPVILLILLVLGSIYTGWATPTEAAAIGCFGAMAFAVYTKTLTFKVIKDALMGTVVTTGMIMFIVCASAYFSVTIGYIGIPRALANFVVESGMSKYMLILLVAIFYLILGCLVDGFSMVVMSVPIILPLITAVGFDPLWFGIFLVIMVQVAQITPPVGFNLFLITGISDFSIMQIAKAAMPLFFVMVLFTIFVVLCPQVVLWLPNLMM